MGNARTFTKSLTTSRISMADWMSESSSVGSSETPATDGGPVVPGTEGTETGTDGNAPAPGIETGNDGNAPPVGREVEGLTGSVEVPGRGTGA